MPRSRYLACLALAVTCLSSSPLPLWAIIVSTTRETTSPPEVDFGWSNVAVYDNATAVYLGDRWMISAGHLNAPTVAFPEVGTFNVDASSTYRIENLAGSGLTKPTDIKLFRLTEDPGLSPLDVLGETPAVGTEVWVAGHGLTAAEEFTYWDVTQRGSRWTWRETSPPGEYSGLKTNGPGVLRWGTNLIEDDETFKNDFDDDILTKYITSTTQTFVLLTEFDEDGSNADDDVTGPDGSTATPFESQAVLNDSGGGMFVQHDGSWKLAGSILSVEGHRDQPDVTRTAIFGNLTYYADLATYIDQIHTRVRFGDFDGDTQLTVADVDALIQGINADDLQLRFDVNRDRQLDQTDLDHLIQHVFETYTGDANLDGVFDTGDLIEVLQGGTYEDAIAQNSTWATGDWNGDLEFNSLDFVAALQQGGFEQGPAVAATAVSVPEPCSWWLAMTAVFACAGVALRRSHRTFAR